ncbi:MAG TPA: ABC-2 family transporter protein [Symbiobacteriaceae bacterium]
MHRGGVDLLYVHLGRSGYLRNTAYRWAHVINNLASAIFGFIYIALWQAVAPVQGAAGDPYTRSTMTGMMVLAQVIAWASIFLPAGLSIQQGVRTGAIALEMARPVPYFPMVMAREAGATAYRALYRSLPLALLFAVTVGFPRPASAGALLYSIPSVLLAAYVGHALVYTVGISSLWTTEVRYAHWLYSSASTLLSGGWVPANILPGVLGTVAPYLPFAAQAYYPVRIYLGLTGPEGLLVQAAWAAVLTLWCLWLTRRALRRVVVQGG